jgi:membrane dipeptidase
MSVLEVRLFDPSVISPVPILTFALLGDFDGTPVVPEGLEDVSKYPNLIEELMRRGASEEDLAKFTQLNILRVWEANEKIAKRLQKTTKPSEATWVDREWRQNYYGLPYMFSHSAQTRIQSKKGPQSKTGRKVEV